MALSQCPWCHAGSQVQSSPTHTRQLLISVFCFPQFVACERMHNLVVSCYICAAASPRAAVYLVGGRILTNAGCWGCSGLSTGPNSKSTGRSQPCTCAARKRGAIAKQRFRPSPARFVSLLAVCPVFCGCSLSRSNNRSCMLWLVFQRQGRCRWVRKVVAVSGK
jgi:hypothetical protein